jgi:hypothetical protein
MAAWGYTFGIAYISFFGQLQRLSGTDPSGMAQGVVIAFKGFGLLLSVTCLALAWRSPGTPSSGGIPEKSRETGAAGTL